jgi:magnesium transporter
VQLDDEEINELSARMNLPFELQCLDAVLHAVTELLANEADELEEKTLTTIEHLLKVESAEGKFAQEMLRASKNNVHAMISRVNGFNRAMTQILNEEEDLALCNLSRLISHPERFIQPVSPQILEEESDEPELILVSGIVAFAW